MRPPSMNYTSFNELMDTKVKHFAFESETPKKYTS